MKQLSSDVNVTQKRTLAVSDCKQTNSGAREHISKMLNILHDLNETKNKFELKTKIEKTTLDVKCGKYKLNTRDGRFNLSDQIWDIKKLFESKYIKSSIDLSVLGLMKFYGCKLNPASKRSKCKYLVPPPEQSVIQHS